MAIDRLPSGHYRVRIANVPGGKRVAIGTFNSEEEAKIAQGKALGDRRRGIDLDPERISLGELVERYIETRIAIGRATKTTDEYTRLLRNYVRPHLGGHPVRTLTSAHLASWTTTIKLHGGVDGRALGAKSVRAACAVVSAAFDWAESLEIVPRNPMKALRRHLPPLPRSKARAFSTDDVGRLAAAARGGRWEHALTLALTTALRRGELVGLSWPDVDLERREMLVRHSYSKSSVGLLLKSTKSGEMNRVPLSPPAIAALRAQRAVQAADRLRARPGTYRDDKTQPVFTDVLGVRQNPQSLTYAFAQLAKKAGVAITAVHSTRHTAITRMIAKGVDIKTVSTIARHADPAITLRTYAHLIEGADHAAVDALGEELDRAMRGER